MMAARHEERPHLLHGPAFESFRPRLREQADLSKTNWFRVGGPAEFLFRPEDTADLSAFLRLLPREIPVTVLGVGSNLIVRDGGIDGVVIKLGRGFAQIAPSPACGAGIYVTAGGAALDVNIAQAACEHGLAGLEFLSGIPGTLGGAVRMNAGAYGADMSQVLMEAQVVLRDGSVKTLSRQELGFVYRGSALPEGSIVTQATLAASLGEREEITKRMQQIATAREETQPVRTQTGGSTFRNPEGHKAWELIERAGCRGLKIGNAQVSEKHCNFLINTGGATAADLEALGEEVRRRVRETSGMMLEWEIKRIGTS